MGHKDTFVVKIEREHMEDINYIANSYISDPVIEPNINSALVGASVADRERVLTRDCRRDAVVAFSELFRTRYLGEEIIDEFRRLHASSDPVVRRAAEVYSTVSAVEAAGSLAERQLIHRMTGFHFTEIKEILNRLDETVIEDTLASGVGAYIWHTRHPVIAGILAEYNLPSALAWQKLVRKVATAVNPALQHELSIFRRLLSSRFARERLGSKDERIDLFNDLLRKFPGERFLWHRLVSTYRAGGTLAECRHALDEAIRVVGIDPPLARYELLLLKDEATNGSINYTDQERVIRLRGALEKSAKFMQRFCDDKYIYDAYGQVAYELLRLGERDPSRDDVLARLSDARERLLDPWFDQVTANTIARLRAL